MIRRGSSMPKHNTSLRPLCIPPMAHIVDCTVSAETNPSKPGFHLNNEGKSRHQFKLLLLARHMESRSSPQPLLFFAFPWGVLEAGVVVRWHWRMGLTLKMMIQPSQTHNHGEVYQRRYKKVHLDNIFDPPDDDGKMVLNKPPPFCWIDCPPHNHVHTSRLLNILVSMPKVQTSNTTNLYTS